MKFSLFLVHTELPHSFWLALKRIVYKKQTEHFFRRQERISIHKIMASYYEDEPVRDLRNDNNKEKCQ